MPKFIFRPTKTLLKTAEYTSIFVIAFSFLFVARKLSSAPNSGQGQSTIFVQTWDQIDVNDVGTFDPNGGAGTKLLKSLDVAGSLEASGLYKGASGTAKDGDLVELGFYKLANGNPNTDGTNLFVGTWTPITTKTTIGHLYDSPANGWTDSSNRGEFFFDVTFTRDSDNDYSGTAQINTSGPSDSSHQITDDTPTSLGSSGSSNSGNLYLLDNATEGTGVDAHIGIRFYDIAAGSDTGWNGSNKSLTATRYQTIMDPNWNWDTIGGDMNADMFIHLHDTSNPGNARSTLEFEFDNSAANTANLSKVGRNDTQVVSDNFVTTIAYHDGSGNLDLKDGGLGSAIVSAFHGSGTVDGGNDGNVLTINSAAGNTGYDFSGNIYQDSTTSTDLTIIKEGAGEQILSGDIDASDSNNGSASAYLDIQAGTLILKPGNTKTQEFEYLTGATSGSRALTLDNSDFGAQTIELGFANTSSSQTFSGAVTLQGSGTANIIKVVTDTTKDTANYGKEQVLSGIVSGSETLTKSGLGRLMLSGDNTFDGGATDVIIEDGTLVAAHADALGGANTTVVINKGKLEIGDGNNGAVTLESTTVINGSSSGKSIVGGDGTITNLALGDGSTTGSAATDVNVISPGRGISSSLSPSNQQVTLGTGGAVKAMGEMTVTNLDLNPGAVYDWEITDFNGGGGNAGEDWDILNVSDLDFTTQASSTFTVNVFSVASSGSAGAVSDLGVHTGDNGILFLSTGAHGNIDWGHTGTYELNAGANNWQQASYFEVDSRGYNYHNGNINGGWNVWYNGAGDFYLRYSAVPEPSTYMMVMGLLLVPGYRLFRRFRKGVKQEDH